MTNHSRRTPRPTETPSCPWYKLPAVVTAAKILNILLKTLLTILLVAVITGCMVGSALAVYVATSFDIADTIPDLSVINAKTTSVIKTYNETSGEWEDFLHIQGANHKWVGIDEIPLYMQNAVIAIEDERFNDHYGVDWKRTISAFANLILKFRDTEFGGSTLTQQLIKQLTGDNDHSITRKVTEILRAIEMEKMYSKEEIIEAYLNVLPLSDNIKGVAVGAEYYFGKSISELSIAQCAAIASITQNPSYYNPYTHPENLRDRQQTVLYKMRELKFITEDEYQQAMGEELIFRSSIRHTSIQDYYTDMVIEDVIADLQKNYGYGYTQAESMVYYGGLTIYSWEKPELQQRLETLYADESIYPASLEGDDEDPRTAFFAMDYQGRIVATVGDRGKKTGNRVTNISTMSERQAGSTLKPIAVYALAEEMNLIHYSSVVRDAPTQVVNGHLWPPNYGVGAADRGDVLVDYALRSSLNTVPVKLLADIGLERSYNFLTDVLGITTYVEEDKNFSALALGGATYGMHISELTAAYQIFGNGGVYNGLYSYDHVDDIKGNTLLQTTPLGIQAISEDTAYAMNRLLQEVVRLYGGTLYSAVNSSWPNMELYAKTGTTDLNNDVLAVGGTPYYVATSWFGYRYNTEMTYTQAQAVKQLWNKGMLALHEGLEPASFPHWGDTEELSFCLDSGKIATPACKETRVGVYRKSNIPGMCDRCGWVDPSTTTTTPEPGTTTQPSDTSTTTQPGTTTTVPAA